VDILTVVAADLLSMTFYSWSVRWLGCSVPTIWNSMHIAQRSNAAKPGS